MPFTLSRFYLSVRGFLFCVPAFCAYAMPNPATVHCSQLNYTIQGDLCVFPDGSTCDQWSFWRGTCGQTHHLCTRNQGQLVEKNKTMVCVIDGQSHHWTLRKTDIKLAYWQVVLEPDSSQK